MEFLSRRKPSLQSLIFKENKKQNWTQKHWFKYLVSHRSALNFLDEYLIAYAKKNNVNVKDTGKNYLRKVCRFSHVTCLQAICRVRALFCTTALRNPNEDKSLCQTEETIVFSVILTCHNLMRKKIHEISSVICLASLRPNSPPIFVMELLIKDFLTGIGEC